MSHGKDPSLRKQLIEARANIIWQISELKSRQTRRYVSISGGGSPDYRSVIAELEGQLSEIDALLGAAEEPGT